jgi:hypothetical protein
MKMRNSHRSLRKDKGSCPAISWLYCVPALLRLVAMTFANNTLGLKMARTNTTQTTPCKLRDSKLMTLLGQLLRMISYRKYGNMKFQEVALNYTFQVHIVQKDGKSGLSGKTGMILYIAPLATS